MSEPNLAESAENDQLQHTFKGQTTKDVSGGNRKFLWSEKFLALTDHLESYIWLTDLYFEQERDAAPKGDQAAILKLIINGQ